MSKVDLYGQVWNFEILSSTTFFLTGDWPLECLRGQDKRGRLELEGQMGGYFVIWYGTHCNIKWHTPTSKTLVNLPTCCVKSILLWTSSTLELVTLDRMFEWQLLTIPPLSTALQSITITLFWLFICNTYRATSWLLNICCWMKDGVYSENGERSCWLPCS